MSRSPKCIIRQIEQVSPNSPQVPTAVDRLGGGRQKVCDVGQCALTASELLNDVFKAGKLNPNRQVIRHVDPACRLHDK